jgi:hypothetical protein
MRAASTLLARLSIIAIPTTTTCRRLHGRHESLVRLGVVTRMNLEVKRFVLRRSHLERFSQFVNVF